MVRPMANERPMAREDSTLWISLIAGTYRSTTTLLARFAFQGDELTDKEDHDNCDDK